MKNLSKLEQSTLSFNIVLTLILLATITRIAIPPFFNHLPNFAAVDALALFSGVYFRRRLTALIIIFFSVWLGDIFLNKMWVGEWQLFYPGCYWQYLSYFLITYLGSLLKNNLTSFRILTTCFLSSILFFIISNFGVWYSGLLYPLTLDGLVSCYIAAIPFFKNTIFSDLFFTIVLFSSAEMIQFCFSEKLSKQTI